MKVCKVEGCDKNIHAKGLCRKHYERLADTGSLYLPKVSCSICGTEFEARDARQKTCSKECSKTLRNNISLKWDIDNPEKKKVRQDNFLQARPLYSTWLGMKQRCYRKNHRSYPNYGGRGIKVCSRWKNDYQAFEDDLLTTYKEGLTLDRENNDGNYEPENCRWATWEEQNSNKRVKT
ncbi:hypothetical protein HN682_10075 [Candidatus Peregrinibacteria bacterium]|nr:hypothetical protein [Candidatus Peregrinibacteria bacterium]